MTGQTIRLTSQTSRNALMVYVSKIATTIYTRKFILAITILSALILIFVFPETAFAQAKTETLQQEIIAKANTIISFLSGMLWPLLLLIGALLDNELIFGSGAEERLLTIWVQFRDFANILFVIVLIYAAFRNIFSFTETDEKWQIQKILPKFIMGLILINFSFVGAKVVLDVSNVVTSAVFALPDSILQQQQQITFKERAKQICDNVKKTGKTPATASPWDAWASRFCKIETRGQAVLMESMLTNFNTRNAPFAMAINMGKLHIMDLKKETAVFIKDFVINSLFSLLMFVLYGLAFISLAVVLLERLIVLWIVVAFSPLLLAGYLLKDYLGEFGSQAEGITPKVRAAVTAPIIIGLSMSVGYIMLDVFNSREDFYFDLPLGDTSTQITGTEDLRQLLIGITAAYIVWKGAEFATKESITPLGGIITGLRDKAKLVGNFLASAPLKFIPAVPIPMAGGKTQKMTLQQLADLPATLINSADAKYQKSLNALFGGGVSEKVTNLLAAAKGASAVKAREMVAKFLVEGHNLNKQELKVISEYVGKTFKSGKDDAYVKSQLDAAAKTGVFTSTISKDLAQRLYPGVKPNAAAPSTTVTGTDNSVLTIQDKRDLKNGILPKNIEDYLTKKKNMTKNEITAAWNNQKKRTAAGNQLNYSGVFNELSK